MNLNFSDIINIFKWAASVEAEWRLYDDDIKTLKRLHLSCTPDQKDQLYQRYPNIFRIINSQ